MGIGTNTPRGILDLNVPSLSNMGLVLPISEEINTVINPQGGDITEGTIIYDKEASCIKYYDGKTWSKCLYSADSYVNTLTPDCSSNGFSGKFLLDSDTNTTFTVNLNNYSDKAVALNF